MKELSNQNLEEVSGGPLPVLAVVALKAAAAGFTTGAAAWGIYIGVRSLGK